MGSSVGSGSAFVSVPSTPSHSPSQGPQAAGPPGQQAKPQAQQGQHSHSSGQQGHRGCRKNMGVVNPRPWELPTPTPAQRAVTWGAGRLIAVAGGPMSWRPGWSSQLLEAPKWTRSWAPRDPEWQGRAGGVIAVDERDSDIPGGGEDRNTARFPSYKPLPLIARPAPILTLHLLPQVPWSSLGIQRPCRQHKVGCSHRRGPGLPGEPAGCCHAAENSRGGQVLNQGPRMLLAPRLHTHTHIP